MPLRFLTVKAWVSPSSHSSLVISVFHLVYQADIKGKSGLALVIIPSACCYVCVGNKTETWRVSCSLKSPLVWSFRFSVGRLGYFLLCKILNLYPTFFLLSSEAMTMGKLHKEIGQLIVQSAEDPEKSDSQVIQVTLDLP